MSEDAFEEHDEVTKSGGSWALRLMLVIGVIGAVIGVGAIGQVSGVGWFNHRPMLYGEGELYVLNMWEEAIEVSVDGREPVGVPPQQAQLIELIGGTSKVEVTKGGEAAGSWDVTIENSDALLNLGAKKCLAVVDIQPYYGGANPDDVSIVREIGMKDEVVVVGSNNVVWPRKSFPPRLAPQDGPGRWVELVGCPLLEDEPFLKGYLNKRLSERMSKALGVEP